MGGRNLALLGKPCGGGHRGRKLEIACHRNGPASWQTKYEGIPLPELIRILERKLIGEALPQEDVDRLPLLVKLIDALENLSVQVHPGDEYAYAHENGEYGKTEMWYIISAKPGAKLVHGVVPGTTRESFALAIAGNYVERCLNTIEVSAGDVVYIPAGMVHAICRGFICGNTAETRTRLQVYDTCGPQGNCI